VPAGVEYHPVTASPIPAPLFVGELLDGSPADAATLFAGRPAVISFIASWCGACTDTQATLAELKDTYGDAIALVSVAGDGQDTREDLTRFVRDSHTTWPVVFDPDTKTWRNYSIREAPAIGVVDSAGSIVRLWAGGTDRETVETTLAELVTLPD
jgi:thiol-disulfide isomerase/thioredoxin